MSQDAQQTDPPLVLIVDDDGEVRRMLASALGARGFRTDVAPNGREALDRVRAEVPRLIVLDYWMPVLDGAGFMREMRALLPERPPVILLTAVQDKPELARALGVDVYVEKPVQMSRLVRLVEATLRGGGGRAITQVPASERRERARLSCRRAAWVRVDGEAHFRAASMVDISEGGLCVELVDEAAVGVDTPMGVAMQLAPGWRVELPGRVRHRRGSRIGIQFEALDPTAVSALQKLLAEAEAPRR